MARAITYGKATGVFAPGGSAQKYFAKQYTGTRATGVFAPGGSAQRYFAEHYGSGSRYAGAPGSFGRGGYTAPAPPAPPKPVIVESGKIDVARQKHQVFQAKRIDIDKVSVDAPFAQLGIWGTERSLTKPKQSSSEIDRNYKKLEESIAEKSVPLDTEIKDYESAVTKSDNAFTKLEENLAPYKEYEKVDSEGVTTWAFPRTIKGNYLARGINAIIKEADIPSLMKEQEALKTQYDRVKVRVDNFNDDVVDRDKLAGDLSAARSYESSIAPSTKYLVAGEVFGLKKPGKTFEDRYTKYFAEMGYPKVGTLGDIGVRIRAGIETGSYKLGLKGTESAVGLTETLSGAKSAFRSWTKASAKKGDVLAPYGVGLIDIVSPIVKPVVGVVGYGMGLISALSSATGEVVGEAAFSLKEPSTGIGLPKLKAVPTRQLFPGGFKIKVPTAEGIITAKPSEIKYAEYEVKPVTMPTFTGKQVLKGGVTFATELLAYQFIFDLTLGKTKDILSSKYGSTLTRKQLQPGLIEIKTPSSGTAVSKTLITTKPVAKTSIEKYFAKKLVKQAEIETFTEIVQVGQRLKPVSLFRIAKTEKGIMFTTRKGAEKLLRSPKHVLTPNIPMIRLTGKEIERLGGTIKTITQKELGKISKLGEFKFKTYFPSELVLSSPEFSLVSRVRLTPLVKGVKQKPIVFSMERFQEAVVPRLQRYEASIKVVGDNIKFDFPLKSKQFESLVGTRFELTLIEDAKKRVLSPIYGIRKTSPVGTRLLPSGQIQKLKTIGKEITYITDQPPKFIKTYNFSLGKGVKSTKSLKSLQASIEKGFTKKGIILPKITPKKLTTSDLIDISLRKLPKEPGVHENVIAFFKRLDKEKLSLLAKQKAHEKYILTRLAKKTQKIAKKQLKKPVVKGFKETSFGPVRAGKGQQIMLSGEGSMSRVAVEEARKAGVLPQQLFFDESTIAFKASDLIPSVKTGFSAKQVFGGIAAKNIAQNLFETSASKQLVESKVKLGAQELGKKIDYVQAGLKKISLESKSLVKQDISQMKGVDSIKMVSVAKIVDVVKAADLVKASELSLQPKVKFLTKTVTKPLDLGRPSIIENIIDTPPPSVPTLIILSGEQIVKKERKKLVGGFSPFVKEKGKFFKASKKVFTKKGALAFAGNVADNSVARTIMVKKAKKRVPFNELEMKQWGLQAKKFRKKNNTYIEKSKYAIDSVGELAGITAKGLLKQRQMRAAGIPFSKKARKEKIQFDVTKQTNKKKGVLLF